MGALLDDVMPSFQAVTVARAEIEAPATIVFSTARDLDLLAVRSPLTDAAMWVRGLADRLQRRSPAPFPRLSIGDLFDRPSGAPLPSGEPMAAWVPLAERAPEELVFGAIGKVWRPSVEWRTIDPSDFPAFREPGWARIAVSVEVRARSTTRSALLYEARTDATSPDAARRFAWYWRMVSPFVAMVMRAFVRTVRDELESQPQKAARG